MDILSAETNPCISYTSIEDKNLKWVRYDAACQRNPTVCRKKGRKYPSVYLFGMTLSLARAAAMTPDDLRRMSAYGRIARAFYRAGRRVLYGLTEHYAWQFIEPFKDKIRVQLCNRYVCVSPRNYEYRHTCGARGFYIDT